MDIISLPKYLELDESIPIQLFDYQISEERLKNKINLTQNTFSFLQEGTKEVITNLKPITIHNSDFLIIKSGHCLMTEKLSPLKNIYRSLLLFFSNEALLEFIRKQNIPNQKPASSAPIQICAYDEFISSFVKSLIGIKELRSELQKKLLQLKFEEIMLYLVHTKGSDFLFSLLSNTDNQTGNMIKVVENNRLNKLTIKELSFLSNMSLSSFKREFEKHYQDSPSKWFQDQRLEHSAFLLRNHSKRPTELFEEAGYENLSNYIQAFKVKFGTTPKQYQSKN